MTKDVPSEVDVIVVGGGPAGLAAAISARMKGFSALVADARRPPIDKPCGEGLLPDGVAALKRLGVDPDSATACSFRGIRFVEGEHAVQADFPSGVGLGMRRAELHSLLLRRAEETGVATAWGCPVTGMSGTTIRMGDREITGRWVVGADGIQSRVRRWAGLEAFRRDTRRFAFRTHYRIAPWSEYVEIYWGQSFQIYITPVASDEVCVAIISADPKLRIREALASVPRVGDRLLGVPESSLAEGALTATRRLRSVYRGGAVLIGDASGSVDAITGQGMCLAFQQAAGLGDALARSDLKGYAARRRRLSLRPVLMADFLLTLSSRPRLRQRAIRAMCSKPAIFTALLAAHVGAGSVAPITASALSLGWEMLR